MSFLNSSDQYTDENGIIVPWMYDQHFVDEWNAVAHQLKFRVYVDKGSRFASRKRLSGIISANAQYLGGSRKTSKRILTKRFLEQFICACSYLKTQDFERDMEPLEVMGKEFHRTMSVWVWLRPDIRAIVHLAGLYNNEPDALAALELDRERRAEKAKIIKAFRAGIDEFIERAAYMTGSGEGSNDHLQGIFNIASRGLLLAREAMEWEEDD